MTVETHPAPPAVAARHPLLDWPALSADYAQYHRSTGNRACHALGIPLIVLALVAWTQVPALGRFPLVAAILPVYLAWDVALFVGMAVSVALLALAAPLLPGWGAGAAFVVGWILQLVGHQFYEGQSPAFLRNLVHLLVGPAWLLEKLLRPGRAAR